MGIVDWIYPRKCVNCKRSGNYVCQRCRELVVRRGLGLRYTGVVRKMIKAVKYRGTYDMVRELVEIWDPPVPDQSEETIITWVPMWEPKRKLRGFDQAELIARELGKRWGMETKGLLIRTRETEPMYGLKKSERVENVRGAFTINSQILNSPILKLKRVVLVDDVWTSGATMSECAKALHLAGWRYVDQRALAS